MSNKNDKKIYCLEDGLIACEVKKHARDKHNILKSYVDITRSTRAKYLPSKDEHLPKGGAVYIDLFCGPGRSKIKNTDDWIDGSPIVAWKESLKNKTPFTKVLIADFNKEYVDACKLRLEKLGATVFAIDCMALDAINHLSKEISPHALNFCFIDPYNLKSLDFKLIEALSKFKRMDILIHLSKMDLQRNLASNLRNYDSDFDAFVPGWRENFKTGGLNYMRQQIVNLWVEKVKSNGAKISKSTDWHLITGEKNQPLYWLMLIANHELAIKFWEDMKKKNQRQLF